MTNIEFDGYGAHASRAKLRDAQLSLVADRKNQRPACMNAPDMWFSDAAADIEFARNQCQSCPLRQPCHDAGSHEKNGVWGGLDNTARRRQNRARKASGGNRAGTSPTR